MPNDLISLLIKFLPTILVGLAIFGCMMGGFFRGFRKSNILLIHYLIALSIGFVAYFALSKKAFTADLNFIFSMLGGEYANAHTIYEFVEILMITNGLEGYSSLANNYYFQGLIQAFGGLAINLALGIVCLVLLPWVIRFILRIFYIMFYSERKRKKHKRAEGETYHRHRFLGMFTGILRGVVVSTLLISFFNASLFIVAGGDFKEVGEESKNISLLDTLGKDSGIELNLYYNALKESRYVGVGALYEKIRIKDTPIDYYYNDLFSSSTFNTVEEGVTTNFVLREETALFFNLAESLLETNVITIVNDEVVVDNDKLLNEVPQVVNGFVNDSVIFSELLPLAIIGAVDEVQKGNIEIHPDIVQYFKDNDIYSKVKAIDLAGDLGKTINACVTLVKLFYNSETKQFELDSLSNPLSLLKLSTSDVELVFTSLSEITLITDVIFPVGMGIVFNNFQSLLTENGISTDDINLSIIDWKFEIKNLGTIFSNIVKLELDTDMLLNTEVNESGKTNQMDYLTSYIQSAANKEKLLTVVDSIMDSNLTSQFMLVMLKKFVCDLNVVNEDGSINEELNASLAKVKHNLNARDADGKLLYDVEVLRKDMHTLVESCLGILELFAVFGTDASNPLAAMKNVNIDLLREALIGSYKTTGVADGGLYEIRFLSGNFDDLDGVDPGLNNATDAMVETLLVAYTGSFLYKDDILSVKDKHGWPEELSTILDVIEVIQSTEGLTEIDLNNIMGNFPKLADSDVDKLTSTTSKSILLGGMLKSTIKEALVNVGDTITINVSDDEWLDEFNEKNEVTQYGELNKMLKILVLFGKYGISLSDTNSLLSGLAKFENTAESKDIDKLTNSKVIKDSLNDIIKEMLYSDDENATLPEGLVWETTYNEDGSVKEVGELEKVINILKIEILQDENNSFSVSKLSDINTIASLSNNEVDTITSSLIVKDMLDSKVPELLEIESISDEIKWDSTYDSEGNLLETGEFQKIVNILKIDALKNNDGNVDINTLSNISTIASLSNEDVDTVTASIIVKDMLDDKVGEMLYPDGDKELPEVVWETTYHEDGSVKELGELQKIVTIMNIEQLQSHNEETNQNEFDMDKLSNANVIASLEDEDVDKITASVIVKDMLDDKVPEVLGIESISSDITWETEYVGSQRNPGEFQRLVNILKIDALKDENNDISVDRLSNATVISSLNDDEVDTITASVIVKDMLDDKVGEMLYPDGEKELPEVTWETTYNEDNSVNETGEFQKLVNILKIETLKDENGEVDVDRLSNATAISKLDSEEVDTITASVIVKDMLDDKVGEMLYPDGEKELPEVTWETTYNEDNSVNETGEFQKLVNILKIESLQDENDEVDVDRLSNATAISKLENSEVDTITSSVIVKDMLDDKVTNMVYGEDSTKTLPEGLVWETTYKENGNVDKSGEFQNIVNILKLDALKGEGDSVDVDRLSDLDNIARLIKKNLDSTLNYDDVVTIAKSKVMMSAMDEKISGISTDDMKVIVPDKLKQDSNTKSLQFEYWEYWSYSSGYDYKTGEFGKMVYTLFCAREYVLTVTVEESGSLVNKYSVLDTDNLVEAIIGMSDHSVVTSSLVMYATISNKLIELSEKETPEIQIREEAKIKDSNALVLNDNITIFAYEIISVLDIARDLEITDFANVETETVLEKVKSDDLLRAEICKSNIMNITVVDKIVTNNNDALTINDNYQNITYNSWYPVNKDNWETCELNKVFLSIKELDVKANGNAIEFDSEEVVYTLNEPSVTSNNSSDTKIDVVYNSEIMAETISDYIINDSDLSVPTEYKLNGSNEFVVVNDNVIVREEIKTLVDSINILNISLDANYNPTPEEIENNTVKIKVSELKPSHITALEVEDINKIFSSAIISLKTAEILEENQTVEVPTNAEFTAILTNGNTEEAVYTNEIKELLFAVKEFNFDVDSTSAVTFDLTHVTEERLEKRLELSNVFHATMSVQITKNVTYVPEYYYEYYKTYDNNKKVMLLETLGDSQYLTSVEIAYAVDVLKTLGFTDAKDAKEGISSSFISTLEKEQVANIDKSGVIAAMVSDALEGVEIPNTITVANMVDLFKHPENEVNIMKVVNGGELKALMLAVIGITPAGSTLDIAKPENLSMDQIDSTGLSEGVNNSYILRATLSNKITDTEGLHVPTTDINEISITDELNYLVASEITTLITTFKTLGLDFDEIDSNSLGNLNVSIVLENIDNMLDSAIIHSLLSENLINQEQKCNEGTLACGIVTYEFNMDVTNKFEVTKEVNETKYVVGNEINELLEGLSTLGVNNISQASSINSSYLATVSQDPSKIAAVEDSAILSTIFGNILINETELVSNDKIITHKMALNGSDISTVSQEYIANLLTNYSTII